MQEVRLNLYQREFQVEIGGGGFGYRLLGPKFDGSSRLIKSVILSDRDKEEIIGYVKPDAKAIEEERDRLKAELEHERIISTGCSLRIQQVEAENAELIAQRDSPYDAHVVGYKKLETELDEARREIERLREALEKALPRMAHRFECVSVLPSEMWHQSGSTSLDSCVCEIKAVKAALAGKEREDEST